VNPRTITVEKNAAYPKATAETKKGGELWRCSRRTGRLISAAIMPLVTDAP
jgi:hypothetical protein